MERNQPDRSYRKRMMMDHFKIKKVRPMFTAVITTSRQFVDDSQTQGGLYNPFASAGGINYFQTVVAVGSTVTGVKEGDIIKINFDRYARAEQKPTGIDDNNVQKHKAVLTYDIPIIDIDGERCLFLQNNDIEYVVTEYEVDESGLLQ